MGGGPPVCELYMRYRVEDECPDCQSVDWVSMGVSHVQCRSCGYESRTFAYGRDYNDEYTGEYR